MGFSPAFTETTEQMHIKGGHKIAVKHKKLVLGKVREPIIVKERAFHHRDEGYYLFLDQHRKLTK